jgi:hypothetical protein
MGQLMNALPNERVLGAVAATPSLPSTCDVSYFAKTEIIFIEVVFEQYIYSGL